MKTAALLIFGTLLVAGLRLLVWMAKRDADQFWETSRRYQDPVKDSKARGRMEDH